MRTVRAAVACGDGRFAIETIGLHEPQHGEVLVAIKASGVCHTDWDSLNWGRPLILGHEGAGIVAEVGEGVFGIAPGDRVLLNWAIPCGRCFQCCRGKENICENRGTVPDARYQRECPTVPTDAPYRSSNSGRASARSTGSPGPGGFNASFSLGTMATYALVPAAAVLLLPDDVPFEIAAIIGCAVMTGFGSVVNAAQVAPGSTVVVLGCGGVGLSAILGAHYCAAERIIAIDINPTRLQLATEFGATETLLASASDKGLLETAKEIRRRCDGRGADYAFECTAVAELGAAPLAMVRNAGTAVGVSGIEKVVPIDMEAFEWDKIYINPLYGACRPQRDFPLLLGLYRAGQISLDAMVTRRYNLDGLDQAFRDMHAGINAKGVLLLD